MCAVRSGMGSGLYSALEVGFHAFFQVLTGNLSEFSPQYNFVEFGTLLLIPLLGFPLPVGCQANRTDGSAAGGCAQLRIAGEIADQVNAIETSCHRIRITVT